MPIYEYQCKACGHQLEAFQKVNDEPLKECPVCQKITLDKLVSSTSFQLKGTGWYVTDFRNKGQVEKKEASTKEASTKEGNAEGTVGTTTTAKTGDSTTA